MRSLGLWFWCLYTIGALAMPVLALAGALPWDSALSLAILIGCGGSVIEEIVTRARRGDGDDGPGLTPTFVTSVILGVLVGAALAVWVG